MNQTTIPIPRLVVMDMDGTLLNSRKEITPETAAALRRLQDRGTRLVLASGRPERGLMRFARQLDMKRHGGILISSNGALARTLDGRTLYSNALTRENTRKVLKHLKQFDVIPMIADGDSMLVENVYNCMIELDGRPWNVVEYEARSNGFLLREVRDLSEAGLTPEKILTAGTPAYLRQVSEKMRAPFCDSLDSMFTGPFYYEFTASGSNKGTALKAVMEACGVSSLQTAVFGDAENDLPMFAHAAITVAMGNATEPVRNQARYITASNDEDGIVRTVESWEKIREQQPASDSEKR